jgi:hypothetical protein
LLQGTITTKTAITLEDLKLPYATSGTGSDLFNVVYLKLGSSTFTWTPDSSVGGNST